MGIRQISRPDDDDKLKPVRLPNGRPARNRVRTKRVLDEGVASSVDNLLQGVVKSGTGTRAQLGAVTVAGKTGTTENYGDAWFVGYTRDYTVAVWVGYPNRLVPMKTEFNGEAVAGGTYPAGIWKTFMESVIKLDPPAELKDKDDDAAEGVTPDPGAAVAPTAPSTPAPSEPAPETDAAAARRSRSRRSPRPSRTSRPTSRPPSRRPRRRRRPRTARPPPPAAPPRPPAGLARSARRHGVAQARGPRPRHERKPAAQKRHGSSAAFVIPIRGPSISSTGGQPAGGGSIAIGPRTRSDAVELELDPERLGELARPRAEVLAALEPAPRAHLLDALERLERADQHRRADALRLADRVDERVDAVGAVDVGAPRRAEEDVRAPRQADVGVAGGLGLVVGLGLDDRAGAAVVAHDAADERPCDVDDGPRVEVRGERAGLPARSALTRAGRRARRARGQAARARAASAVPPSETFDSSHERCSSSV